MDYREVISALRDYSEMVEASSQKYNGDPVSTADNTDADFEKIICNYLDALGEIKRIRNRNKRYCLIYDALGYYEREIAEKLRISTAAVCKNLKWLKKYFSKVVNN